MSFIFYLFLSISNLTRSNFQKHSQSILLYLSQIIYLGVPVVPRCQWAVTARSTSGCFYCSEKYDVTLEKQDAVHISVWRCNKKEYHTPWHILHYKPKNATQYNTTQYTAHRTTPHRTRQWTSQSTHITDSRRHKYESRMLEKFDVYVCNPDARTVRTFPSDCCIVLIRNII